MLTHCPECQKELSTAATVCPHCGAPVDHGMVKQQQQPQIPQQPIAAPPKSHFLRNCLLCGCLLAVLAGVAVFALPVYMVAQIQKSVVQKADAPALAAKVAPGVAAPPGYEIKGGIDFAMFGIKAEGVAIAPTDVELGKGKEPKTLLAFGAFSGKTQSKEQIHDQVEKFLTQMSQGGGAGAGGQRGSTKIVTQEEVDVNVGPGTDTVKAMHMVTEDERSQKRMTEWIVVVDDYDNEFGYLIVAGMGSEKEFDEAAFKAFLKTVNPKKK